MPSTLVFASLLGLAAAQNSVISIPFYILDTQSIEASIVSANPAATTMALNCPSGTDANDCGLFPQMTLVYGPSTYHLDMGVSDAQVFTGSADCNRAATVTCTEFASGSEANFPGSSTTTYEGEDILTLPVTVTSGAEKLGAQASATGSASASGGSSGSATSGSAPTASTASVTQIVGTNSAYASGASRTQGASASATPSTGVADSVVSKGGLVGAVAGLVGGLLL